MGKSQSQVCERFNLRWSFSCGHTTNVKTFLGFRDHPHNIKEGIFLTLGCCLKHPMEKDFIPVWKKELYCLGSKFFAEFIPSFVSHQYMIHFSRMDSRDHYVRLHVDERDISSQYAIYLGTWKGASLVCYSSSSQSNLQEIGRFNESRALVHMDGRLLHYMDVQPNFKGIRYAMICYQLWNEKKDKPDPIFSPPALVLFDFLR